MRQIKDKGIAKLYAAALRAKKAKHTKGKVTKGKAKRRGSPQAKVATVMREFYAGGITTHGRKVPRGRPDIAKVLRTAAASARKPKRRVKRRKVLRTAVAAARKPKRRVVKRTAKRQSSAQLDHRVIRHAAPTRGRKQAKRRKGSKVKASPAQLAARKRFAEMARERSRLARAGRRPVRSKLVR